MSSLFTSVLDSKLSPNIWVICYIKYRFHFTVFNNIRNTIYCYRIIFRVTFRKPWRNLFKLYSRGHIYID